MIEDCAVLLLVFGVLLLLLAHELRDLD